MIKLQIDYILRLSRYIFLYFILVFSICNPNNAIAQNTNWQCFHGTGDNEISWSKIETANDLAKHTACNNAEKKAVKAGCKIIDAHNKFADDASCKPAHSGRNAPYWCKNASCYIKARNCNSSGDFESSGNNFEQEVKIKIIKELIKKSLPNINPGLDFNSVWSKLYPKIIKYKLLPSSIRGFLKVYQNYKVIFKDNKAKIEQQVKMITGIQGPAENVFIDMIEVMQDEVAAESPYLSSHVYNSVRISRPAIGCAIKNKMYCVLKKFQSQCIVLNAAPIGDPIRLHKHIYDCVKVCGRGYNKCLLTRENIAEDQDPQDKQDDKPWYMCHSGDEYICTQDTYECDFASDAVKCDKHNGCLMLLMAKKAEDEDDKNNKHAKSPQFNASSETLERQLQENRDYDAKAAAESLELREEYKRKRRLREEQRRRQEEQRRRRLAAERQRRREQERIDALNRQRAQIQQKLAQLKSRYQVLGHVETESSRLVIQAWDHGHEDGDKVAVYINNARVISSFDLRKNKRRITLNLNNGISVIKIQALNEGSQSPNTASFEVLDNNKVVMYKGWDLYKNQSAVLLVLRK